MPTGEFFTVKVVFQPPIEGGSGSKSNVQVFYTPNFDLELKQPVTFLAWFVMKRISCLFNWFLIFRLPRLDQSDKQQTFARNFGMGNIYDTSDRRGIAVDLLILFRDIHPKASTQYFNQVKNSINKLIRG